MNGGTFVVVLVCVLVGLALGWLASRVALGRRGVLRNAYGNFTEAAPSNAPPGGWQPVDPRVLANPNARPPAQAAAEAAGVAPAVGLVTGTEGVNAEGDALIEVCLSVADRLRESDPRMWKYLHQQLERLDIRPVVPDGESFDAETQDAVGFELTPDARRHLTVATTERAGYTKGGEVLRRPEVIVFREGSPADGAPPAEGTAGDAG